MDTREAAEDSDSIASGSTAAGSGAKRARRSHASELLANLSRLRHNPDFSSLLDVELVVGGERFAAHRVVLSAASPVFSRMFTNGMKESGQRTIELPELDKDSFKMVLNFIYDETIDFSCVEAALDVLEGVRRFQVDSMLNVCIEYLSDNLTPDNCCCILARADQYDLDQLRNKALLCAQDYFETVAHSDAFRDLDFELVNTILQHNSLVVRSEVKVFEAVLAWLGGCVARQQHREALLQLVDLENVAEMDLKLISRKLSECETEAEAALAAGSGGGVDGPFRRKVLDRLVAMPINVVVDSEHMVPRPRYSRQLTITHRIYGVSRASGHCGDEPVVHSPWSCFRKDDLHWRLECWPRGYDNKQDISLSLHLKAKRMVEGYGVERVKFHMFLVKAGESRAVNAKLSREIETSELIERSWGFKSLIPLSRIHDPAPGAGYVDRTTDSIMVGATIYFL